MARKRLSDLLREEAKKPADVAADVADAGATNADATGAGATGAVTPASSPASGTDPAPDATASNRSNSAPQADLEGAIAELQSTLETERRSAQQQQDSLQKEKAQLQSQLQAQMDLVQTLKAETQQIQQLKTDLAVAQADTQPIQQLKAELEEARKVILQLSEANQHLQAQLKAQPAQPLADKTQPAKTQPAKTQSAAPKPMPLPSSPEPGLEKTQPKRQPAPTGIVPMPGRDLPKGREPLQHEVALRKILDHPTPRTALPEMPSEKDSKLGETDIGWMD
jgi:hypothetical protein